MSRLAQRLFRLEGATGGDNAPLDFMLVFVSTDGTPDRMCRYVDGALIEAHDDKQEVSDGA